MNFKTLDILLSKYNKKEIVFIGLGNTDRGDDASGIIILQKLQNIPDYSKCHFIDAGKNPENHLYAYSRKNLVMNGYLIIKKNSKYLYSLAEYRVKDYTIFKNLIR